MRDAVILEMKSNSPRFQFLLRLLKIFPIRAPGEMQKTRRIACA
jgi:hypothetical protein